MVYAISFALLAGCIKCVRVSNIYDNSSNSYRSFDAILEFLSGLFGNLKYFQHTSFFFVQLINLRFQITVEVEAHQCINYYLLYDIKDFVSFLWSTDPKQQI